MTTWEEAIEESISVEWEEEATDPRPLEVERLLEEDAVRARRECACGIYREDCDYHHTPVEVFNRARWYGEGRRVVYNGVLWVRRGTEWKFVGDDK